MDGLAELRAEKAAAQEALAAARAGVKAARQKIKDRAKKEKKVWVLTEGVRRVALIAFAMAGYVVDPATKFLAEEAAKRKWPAKKAVELKTMVEDLFLAVDLQELGELCDFGAPKDIVAIKAAVRLVEEWRLYQWTKGLNYGRGVAPSTETILQRLEEQRLQLPEAVRPTYRGTAAIASARVWAARWRRSFAGKHGGIRCKSDVKTPEIRDKARPNFRPNFRPQI